LPKNKLKKKIAAIVLAAGASTRFGSPKQLLKIGQSTLLANAIKAATVAGCHPVVVVLGANSSLIRPYLDDMDVLIEENKDWEKGMGSSIACGMGRLAEENPLAEGVVLLVCDQPFLSKTTIQKLMGRWEGPDKKIVASEYGDTIGVPALFPKKLFPELLNCQGAGGAKELIMSHFKEVKLVQFKAGEIDIDQKSDLDRLN